MKKSEQWVYEEYRESVGNINKVSTSLNIFRAWDCKCFSRKSKKWKDCIKIILSNIQLKIYLTQLHDYIKNTYFIYSKIINVWCFSYDKSNRL
jgi:hypothetical protein